MLEAPTTAVTGVPFDVTVTAFDLYGNVDTNYLGTVTLTTTDANPGVILPANYTFQVADGGIHTFTAGVTLITPGLQALAATDTANGAITGGAAVTVSAPRVPPPGGGATGPWTPRASGVGRTVQQVVLLDRLFSLLSVKNRPFTIAHTVHKALVDDLLGSADGLLGSTGAGRLGVVPLAIK
jgi:hypothetical protein